MKGAQEMPWALKWRWSRRGPVDEDGVDEEEEEEDEREEAEEEKEEGSHHRQMEEEVERGRGLRTE